MTSYLFKNTQKYVVFGIALTFVLLTAYSHTFGATLSIEPSETVVQSTDQDITFELLIKEVTNLSDFQFDFTYDTSAIELISVQVGDFIGSTGRSVQILGPSGIAGSMTFGAYTTGSSTGISGSGILVQLNFKTKTVIRSELRLSDIILVGAGDIPYTIDTKTSLIAVLRQQVELDMMTKSQPAMVAPGNRITHQISMTNSGGEDVDNAILTLTYPNSTQFIHSSPSPDSGSNSIWTIGTIPTGETKSVYVTSLVDQSLDLNTQLTGTATLVAGDQGQYTSNATFSSYTTNDSDGDGIIDIYETGLDSEDDPTKAMVYLAGTGDAVSLDVTSGKLTDISSQVEDALSNDQGALDFPLGTMEFGINLDNGQDTSTVTINYPEDVEPVSYWNYGPTPDNPTDHWYEFTYDGETGAVIDPDNHTITLHFKDGERGDCGSGSDGRIASPTGAFTVTPPPPMHTITFTAGPYGSIAGQKTQNVESSKNSTQVTAVADNNFKFIGWSGDYTGTGNPLITNVKRDMNITANFDFAATLSVTPTSQQVFRTGDSITFKVDNTDEGSMKWAAQESMDWLTIDKGENGLDDGEIKVTYTENKGKERAGIITVSSPTAKDSPQCIEIIQESACTVKAAFTASVNNRKVTFDTTGSKGELLFDYGDGNKGTAVTHTYAEAGTYTVILTVTESPTCIEIVKRNIETVQPVLAATPSSLEIPETRGTTTFKVSNSGTGTINWTALGDADWFSITPRQGTTNDIITVSYETNVVMGKAGAITVTSPGATNSPLTVEIKQDATTLPLIWDKMESPVLENLSGIWGISENNVFAVGSSGTILHYDGNEDGLWTEMSSSVLYYLRSIWGSSENDIFAVGYQGTVLRYNGNEDGLWMEMETYTSENLRDIWGTSESNVFAVSENGAILHYDGNNDGIWTRISDRTLEALYGIWGSSENDVFAVGGIWNSFKIIHYDGNNNDTWDEMPIDVVNIPRSVWGIAPNNVFAVGEDGLILHYGGKSWREMDSGTSEYLTDIWGSSGNNLFAVGVHGTVLRYDGNTWEKMRTSTSRDLCGVWGSSENDVFVVGRRGTILRYKGTDKTLLTLKHWQK